MIQGCLRALFCGWQRFALREREDQPRVFSSLHIFCVFWKYRNIENSKFKMHMISKSVPIATPSDFLILRYYTYWKRVSNTKKSLCLEMSVFRHFGSWNLENQNIENCHARIIEMQKYEFRKIGQSNRVAASYRVSLGPKQLSHKVSSKILETRFFYLR